MSDGNGNGRRSPLGMARPAGFGVRTLVHKDLELAREEIASKAKRVGVGAGMFGAAGLIAFVALGTLTAAAVVALVGKRNLAAGSPPVPSDTARTVKDDVRALGRELKRGK
jgi:hypothetical protein